MKLRQMKIRLFTAALVASCFMGLAGSRASAATHIEGYYMYRGNYPDNANPGWAEDVDGLTHDRANWFITQKDALWKVPATTPLDSVQFDLAHPGVLKVGWDGAHGDYDHFGDPDYCVIDGHGYVLVPMGAEAATGLPPVLAIFRANDLSYVAQARYPDSALIDVGWCAVDPHGIIYVSNFYDVNKISRFSVVDWTTLLNSPPSFTLQPEESVTLKDEAGSELLNAGCTQNVGDNRCHKFGEREEKRIVCGTTPLALQHIQGGVISPSGEMLYLSCGFDYCHDGDGIHVFDISSGTTGHRVQRSQKGSGHFNFDWSCGGLSCEEVEGLTIWDLEYDGGGSCRSCEYQLHVLVVDQDRNGDEVFLKHYSRRIYVNGNYTGDDQSGEPHIPFKTMNSANDFAWDGAELFIATGSYPETLTIKKRLRLMTQGGPITIGR